MGDLISRKALIEELKTHFDAEYSEDGRCLYSDHICIGEDVEDLIKLVNSQPTAYDVDKVVEQLESLETYTQSITMDKHPFCASEIETVSEKKAIEIVKGSLK